ncbi:permease [Thalassobaculum sp. OXR-137]|uniref:permease n=1 Tax=Thalassobaculum sp. OXR-137 TaxID=3100173 RepID=UPI002AC8B4C6|nr:permease [Thalassobaculum sp. OXR-137]WPZ33611.1 permease [Thalassobaculum sp. OXR-137]
MADMALTTRRLAGRIDWTLVVVLAGFAVLALLDAGQAQDSAIFVGEALLGVAPFLFASIAIAAYAKASGADSLIARAFEGREVTMIGAAALVGALSPFCSCGVIPLIAALLSMGVPLAPVMAFWLASPLMDPSMFFLTAGTLGMDFALFKVAAAIAVGLIGGFGTYAIGRAGGFENPLREGVGNGGCGASSVRSPKQVVWQFWHEPARREKFAKNAWENTLFLGKWLAVAFFLESLMLAYIPAETVSSVIGGEGWLPILGATLVGVPAYLNGYAALPLVGGLIEQGMAPGAGMAFLLAGGVSSIPAMIAVWALARPHVFAVYLGFAFVGAFSMGALYGVIV